MMKKINVILAIFLSVVLTACSETRTSETRHEIMAKAQKVALVAEESKTDVEDKAEKENKEDLRSKDESKELFTDFSKEQYEEVAVAVMKVIRWHSDGEIRYVFKEEDVEKITNIVIEQWDGPWTVIQFEVDGKTVSGYYDWIRTENEIVSPEYISFMIEEESLFDECIVATERGKDHTDPSIQYYHYECKNWDAAKNIIGYAWLNHYVYNGSTGSYEQISYEKLIDMISEAWWDKND